jgi:hypothetical protein
MDANVTENCGGTKALRRSIRELNAAKWKSGEIQSEQPSLEEGLSPFEEPTGAGAGDKNLAGGNP